MVQAPPKPKEAGQKPRNDKPWHQYRREANWRLLEPGWAGNIDDDELACIQAKLKADDTLSFWWGFRPGQKTRSEAAIRRVALSGDPENRASNVRLTRLRKGQN